MPKLPVLKSSELVRILLKLGFEESKETGTSHLVFRHADKRRTTVSRHSGKDIPTGTLRSILRDIELTTEQLKKLL